MSVVKTADAPVSSFVKEKICSDCGRKRGQPHKPTCSNHPNAFKIHVGDIPMDDDALDTVAAEAEYLLGAALSGTEVEDAFTRMKAAAIKANWPQDLTPRVVAADKAWQALKSAGVDSAKKPDADMLRASYDTMLDLEKQLLARIDSQSGFRAYLSKVPTPVWWVGGSLLAVGILGGIYSAFGRKGNE